MLSSILLDTYRVLGYSSVPSQDIVTRLSAFADQTQREIIREPGCEQLLRIQLTFASVADQAEYGLPMALARISQIRDIANERTLFPMSESEYRTRIPDTANFAGMPDYFVQLETAHVGLRPSNASELFLDSTSASDVQTAYWEVLTSGGEMRRGSTTMTGTTAVSLDTGLTTIIQVLDLYLSSPAVGTVTLHEDASGGTELGRITIGQTKVWRKQIALVPTPTDAWTYTVEGERDITPLLNPTDEPIVPPRFHEMISIGIRRREYEQRGNVERRMIADAEWREWRGQLRQYLDNTGGIFVPGGQVVGRSQMGPYFPADYYL